MNNRVKIRRIISGILGLVLSSGMLLSAHSTTENSAKTAETVYAETENPFVTESYIFAGISLEESDEYPYPLLSEVTLYTEDWLMTSFYFDTFDYEESARLASMFGSCLENELIEITYKQPTEEYDYIDVQGVKRVGIDYTGDITGDGIIDSCDAVLMRQQLAKSAELDDTALSNSDVNADGETEKADLAELNNYLMGSVSRFNAPEAIQSVNLCDGVAADKVTSKKADDAFISAQMNFDVELFKRVAADSEENTLVSPLSVMLALSMTANGADGDTLAQMEDVLGSGMLIEDMNGYLKWYSENLPENQKSSVDIAESIWINDSDEYEIEKDFIQKNVDYYNAEVYESVFSVQTCKDINSWINEKTEGLIKSILSEDEALDERTMMYLVNTLLFNAEWEDRYEDGQVSDDVFTAEDGTEYDVSLMGSVEDYYYELDNATGFGKDYYGRNYRFVALLPNEGVSVGELVDSLDSQTVSDALSNVSTDYFVHSKLPKFGYDYTKSLKDILVDMGIEDAFIMGGADFSGICRNPSYAPYIDDVLHKTAIDVNEIGTKAAAVTVVPLLAGSPMKDDRYVYLDRPFVYMIIDNNTNLPLFMGTVVNF